jgi:putative transposase
MLTGVNVHDGGRCRLTAHEKEQVARAERARAVALFRYALIREAADARLSKKDRGELVRQLAMGEHMGPFGEPVRVSRPTIDRWIRAWRAGGFDALLPPLRQVSPRTRADVLELAAALKREQPRRTAAQVARIVATHLGWAPSQRTIQRLFVRLELNTRPDGRPPAAFGRFQAEAPNRLWIADALHGPKIDGRNSYLFAIIDDHSRLVTGHRWGHSEDTLRLEAALRKAVTARGVPDVLYVDNGSAFVSKQFLRACAVLGIRVTHSRPGRPQGRGKVERWFGTVRAQFLVEIAPADSAGTTVNGIDELNTLFTAWVETVYHRRVHDETGQTPLDRWHAHFADPPIVLPDPALLREAFLWAEYRTVAKTATVSLFGNSYCVDPALVGRKVELLFDPFDLAHIEVRWSGTPMGVAVPHRIGRHAHPAASQPSAQPVAETGIDYLRLLQDARDDQRARDVVNFDALTPPTNGQHRGHDYPEATPACDEPSHDQPEPEDTP